MMRSRIVIPAIGVFFLLNFACKKAEVDSDTQSSTDNSVAEQSFNGIGTTIVSVAVKEEGLNKMAENELTCATITLSADTGFPKVLTVDYGAGCTDADENTKKGKLIATVSASWETIGTTIIIQLQDFFVNDLQYTGTVQLTNNGSRSYSAVVTDGSVIASNYTVAYSGERVLRWVEGFDTDTIAIDDVYEITGSSIGVNRNGKSFAAIIIQALRMQGDCKYITRGQISLTPSGGATRTINFGDGSCDASATVTINGTDHTITL